MLTDRIVISELEIANTFNIYFSNIVKNLITQPDKSSLDPSIQVFKDPVQLSIENYQNHNSINLIKFVIGNLVYPNFSFKHIFFCRDIK